MADSLFQGFGQFSRPDTGLASDSFANLSEIFESDKRNALRNIRISPETLDSVYGLYREISREDLRAASGLERLLLPSLHQLSTVFLDRIPTRLFIDKEFYNPEFPLGGVGSSQVKTDKVILFNGSIQCESASYREKTLGSSIFGVSINQTVAMSTSRASLFNIELDTVNTGYYKSAKYGGSVRVRRRSHVNRILLPKSNFLPKPAILESPTHTLTVNVDNGNTGTGTPVKLLATKNTPLRIYCRMATGQIKLTFTSPTTTEDRYFYGIQVQPAQQKPNTTPIEFLPVVSEIPPEGVSSFNINIDITGTGYQNLYDLYLYVYLNPGKIKEIEFSGIDMREFPDRRDIGLIGFNNLESFKLSQGSITILPLWLKTLSTKLRVLDLSDSGDTWRSGPMGWFDIRNPSATVVDITGTSLVPLYTAASYLTIPKKGVFLNENGDDWSDNLFEKYVLNQSRTLGADYRQFTALNELNLGSNFYGRSPRFDDIFPGLESLNWSNSSRPYVKLLYENLPKLNNNGSLISYNINASGADGSIEDIGTSTSLSDNGHISKYKIISLSIGASRSGLYHNISGYINNPTDGSDWSSWLKNTLYIDINRTNVSIYLQDLEWSQLQSLEASYSGGVNFKSTPSPLKTPLLSSLSLYGSGTSGVMPTLGSALDTNSLVTLSVGHCNSLDPITENGIDYLLPPEFATPRPLGSEHKLVNFYSHYLYKGYRLRKNDLQNLHNLELFYSIGSDLTGKFPVFPSKILPEEEFKSITVQIGESDFYDLSSLSLITANKYLSRDIHTLDAYDMNLNGGGSVLPTFEGSSVLGIKYVNINNSLPSTYRSDWSVPTLRNSCILNSHSPTIVSGLSLTTIAPISSSDPEDYIYKLVGGSAMKQKVQVNDQIRVSETGSNLATVLSVSDTEVIISNDISFSGNLYFFRNTVDISGWFKSGFNNIKQFRASNCKLSGRLSILSGFNQVQDTDYPALDLSNNMISAYRIGSLTKIFSGNPRRVTVNLSNNNLSVSSIHDIIREISLIDSTSVFRGCVVRLSGNKLSENDKYSNYTQEDIFPVTIESGPDKVTSLFRTERFNLYEEVTVVDENAEEKLIYKELSIVNLNFSGQSVSSVYYKKRVEKTQVSVENPIAAAYSKLRGIRIILGFVYQKPNTSPVSVSTSYTDLTTRYDSITESGLESLVSCPSEIGSGYCWRNSSNQILKLIT